MIKRRWRVLSWFTTFMLLVYLVTVLPLDTAFPILTRWFVVPLVWIACGALVSVLLRLFVFTAPRAQERAMSVTLLALSLLVCLLVADVGFTAFTNYRSTLRISQKQMLEGRLTDRGVWTQEVQPVKYQPTDFNFELYKPEQGRRARVYGEHYYAELQGFPIIRDSVLTPVEVEFDTDMYGLRNTAGAQAASVFALGDSFCMGYHVSQAHSFPAQLSAVLGQPVYNLCVENSSPMQQVLLLEHMLNTYPAVFKPKRVLWMVFEGNDLEDDYRVIRSRKNDDRTLGRIFENTILGVAADLPGVFRRQSVLRLLTSEKLSVNAASAHSTKLDHYELDGQALVYPLYHSKQFGYRLFRQVYLDRATKDSSYVLNHPNRPALTESFRRMRRLAQKHGFEVTVLIAPTDVRLYRNAFDDFPPVTATPHFIRFLEALAQETGFAHLDLSEALAPLAKSELLYHRDDTHWNDRGNQVVADIVARYLAKAGP